MATNGSGWRNMRAKYSWKIVRLNSSSRNEELKDNAPPKVLGCGGLVRILPVLYVIFIQIERST